MIIALFALAVAMIVGGLLAAVLGWDIVLVERGWTMVLSGSIMAASGALLLGITAAVSKLVDIQSELMRLHAGLSENPDEPVAASSAAAPSLAALAGGVLGGAAAARERAGEEPSVLPPVMDAEEPAEVPHVAPPPGRDRAELPKPAEPEEARPSSASEPSPDEEITEAQVPEFLFAERYRERTEIQGRISDIDESLYASEPEEERSPGTVEEEPQRAFPANEDHRDVAEPEPEPEAAPEEAADEAAPEEPHPASTIIGTYNSGDNKYIMYSDGSIEAQTPQGVFHFKSLDELKEFIASGGESSRGSSAI